jgi:hypothetical protein
VRSVAAGLHGRLKHLNLPQRPPPPDWAAQLPEARAEGPARACAQAMDERTRAIGEQAAERPQPWVLGRLGMPPAQPGPLHEDWVTRAGQAGYARQAAGITDPAAGVGARPEGNPERAAAWDRAAAALNLTSGEHDLRASSRAQLETQVRAYAQAAEAAPPDLATRISEHRTTAAELIRQAEHDQAEGDHDGAAGTRAWAAEETSRAEALAPAQEARTWWERDHETQRQAARAARAELSRRGIPAGPEPRQPDANAAAEHQQDAALQAAALGEPGSLTAWWQQFEAAAQTTEAAIATERENAIADGQPWPPRPAPAPEPAAGTTPVLQQDEAGPGPVHVDPAWPAQIKASQAAAVEAGKAARREASARAYPVTDAEIIQYGARRQTHELHALSMFSNMLDSRRIDEEAQRQARSDYAARTASQAQHQAQASTAPETHHDEPDLEP